MEGGVTCWGGGTRERGQVTKETSDGGDTWVRGHVGEETRALGTCAQLLYFS